jgi:ornithine carbamoyltransferase
MALSLAGRSLVSIADLSRDEIYEVLRVASAQKAGQVSREQQMSLARGKTLAMLFDKSSLRTRVGFEVAMNQLGGHAIYIAPADINLGKRESVPDAARIFGRTVNAISARLSSDEQIAQLAQHAGIPVINAMSDREHPCQALADMLTVIERKHRFDGVEIAWVGDGYNVCHSLMLICALLGANLRVATPLAYEPDKQITARTQELAQQSGTVLTLTEDPHVAVKGADVIYTDVWISAGQEEQATRRRKDFHGFQVDGAMVAEAAEDVIVMHCLPAHRGEEITDEVLDGPHSVVLDQAENRLHTQRALLSLMLG